MLAQASVDVNVVGWNTRNVAEITRRSSLPTGPRRLRSSSRSCEGSTNCRRSRERTFCCLCSSSVTGVSPPWSLSGGRGARPAGGVGEQTLDTAGPQIKPGRSPARVGTLSLNNGINAFDTDAVDTFLSCRRAPPITSDLLPCAEIGYGSVHLARPLALNEVPGSGQAPSRPLEQEPFCRLISPVPHERNSTLCARQSDAG